MLVFDAETDGLLDELTTIHCIHVVDRATGERLSFNGGVYADGSSAKRDGPIEDGLRLLQDADEIGGHNVIGFDVYAFKKLYPWFNPKGRVRDSFAEARVVWSNIKEVDLRAIKRRLRPEAFIKSGYTGLHKLGAWGYRLGILKGEYSGGWKDFTPEMDEYGSQDPIVTAALFDKIDEKGYPREVLDLETEVFRIVIEQERHGVLFDGPAAEKLVALLMARRAELEDDLRGSFKPWWEPERKHGQHVVFTPKRDDKKRGYTAGVPFTKVYLETFNPSSRDQIASRLTTLFGWSPVEFTDGGKPKVDETTLEGLTYPEARLLVEYLTVDKRLSQIAEGKGAWLKKIAADGRIHGRVNPMGTVTHRGSHSDPNLGQVPSAKNPYGHECRALFVVPKGRKLVGVDGEGLQLRVLGHYLSRYDGGAFAESVANGNKVKGTDAHSINRDILKMNERERAKTYIYAYVLGAGDYKLGTIIAEDFTDQQRAAFNAANPPSKQDQAMVRMGKLSRQRIESSIPALARFQEDVKAKARTGAFKGFDGRTAVITSAHTALSSVLQVGEAVIMKRAMVDFITAATERGWVWGIDYAQILWVHDEFQYEVYRPEIAEELGQLAAECIRQAGIKLGVRCPLAGSYAIADTWDGTH